ARQCCGTGNSARARANPIRTKAPSRSVRGCLWFLSRFLRERPPVIGEKFLAVLAQVLAGWGGRIRLIAHQPFPENTVEEGAIHAIGVAEVQAPGDARPVVRVRRRVEARLSGGGQRQTRTVENRRGGGRKGPRGWRRIENVGH